MDISKLKNEAINGGVKDSSQVSKTKGTKGQMPTQTIKGTEVGGLTGSSLEKVTWSPDAELLAHGLQAAKSSPESRSEKVAEIKAAIKNGTYKVDAKAVAEKMLQAEMEENANARKS